MSGFHNSSILLASSITLVNIIQATEDDLVPDFDPEDDFFGEREPDLASPFSRKKPRLFEVATYRAELDDSGDPGDAVALLGGVLGPIP